MINISRSHDYLACLNFYTIYYTFYKTFTHFISHLGHRNLVIFRYYFYITFTHHVAKNDWQHDPQEISLKPVTPKRMQYHTTNFGVTGGSRGGLLIR